MGRGLAVGILLTLAFGVECAHAEAPVGVVKLSPDAWRDLAVRWWRWRVALPELATPARDPLGRFCDVGQTGEDWFLAGYLAIGAKSQTTKRACAVPSGRRLFFPIITVAKFAHGETTCEQAKTAVFDRIGDASDLFARVDGVALTDPLDHRAGTSDCVTLPLAADTKLGSTPAAVDGYWLMLDPLPPGHHVLEYGSGFKPGTKAAGQFQNTTYELDVR